MWIQYGKKTRVRPVLDGRVVEQHCDECGEVRRFVECDIADKVSLFFVPVLDMTSRRLVCTECGDDLEVPPVPDARPARSATPATSSASPPKRPSEGDLDKMLADLKQKLGK